MAIECVNVKPCNSGGSEQHNRRTQDYVQALLMAGLEVYYRQDLTAQNEAFVYPSAEGKTLQQLHQEAIKRYTDKVGQPPQKDRKRKNPKTGRMETRNGFVPLKEAVVLITPETTMEDLQKLAQVYKDAFKINPLQIFTHKDEGHWEVVDGKQEWKPNLHAHIVFDWTDHETGKTLKLGKTEMRRMQDVAAEVLGMERGVSSDKKNQAAQAYRAKALQEEIIRLSQEVSKLKTAIGDLSTSREVKEQAIASVKALGGKISRMVSGSDRKEKAELKLKIDEVTALATKYKTAYESERKKRERAEYKASDMENDLKAAKGVADRYKSKSEAMERTHLQAQVAIKNAENMLDNVKTRLPEVIKQVAPLGLSFSVAVDLAAKGSTEVMTVMHPETKQIIANADNSPILLKWTNELMIKLALTWCSVKQYFRDALRSPRIRIGNTSPRGGMKR